MKKSFAIAALAALIAGCASQPSTDSGAPVQEGATPSTGPSTGAVQERSVAGDPLTDPSHPLYKQLQARSVYFDFDSDAIKPEFAPVVEAHARYLRDNPNRKVRIEGHADERGSREYNIGLGQRRADAIKSRMTLLGASASQIETISYGEEKPRCTEKTESCYAENRRGDLVY
ncbi:MAG: peptidoglycan-associated lipoprotein Pal [Pseudomonadota bacterium]|nr:MAG: peptidoglycan-associated lipoprotein Pal [Pseudomonadota bacterium]